MAQLSPSELRKYSWRADVFIRKLEEGSLFEVRGNKKVKLSKPKDAERILKKGSPAMLRDIRFGDENGNLWKLSDFVKTAEFGGKGAGSGTIKEDIALKNLRDQISEAKSKEGSAVISIKIGPKVYSVYDVVSTPGVPKSDFHCVDGNGKEVAWISHKAGSKAKDFQQWGGLSRRAEPKLYIHPETQKFVKDILNSYPDGLPKATTLARKADSIKLQMMSVYGNEFGSALGRQNVTLMLQGDPILKKKGSHYSITATHHHINGERMLGDYYPTFMAIYKGDRSDFGIAGTRVVIGPYGSRKITSEI